MSTLTAGKLGEEAARELLKKRGYKILDENFRSRFGEIDIVALDPSAGSGLNGTLVFVEVKTRWSVKYGIPEEAVTPWKLLKIIKTGEYYKLVHPETPDLMRVDVIAVEVRGNRVIEARLIKNATQ